MREQTNAPKMRAGYYRCPYDCGDKRFPAPKWKTEKGALAHIAQCGARPEAVAERERVKAEQLAADNARRDAALAGARFKVGDVVSYVHCYVRKPTHEQRNGRLVRMRYEEVRDYSARTETINSVTFNEGSVLYNYCFRDSDMRPTIEEAQQAARTMQEGYDERCRLAEACR